MKMKQNIKTLTKVRLLLCILFAAASVSAQSFKELTPTPPMGWNSWNFFGKHDVNDEVIRECIDAIVSSGLKDAGYNYVVIDGGWRDTKLNDKGELLAHPEKFPNGIKPLVDYAHEKGLKLGLHTVPGTNDCAGDRVGAYGIEEIHIQQFIDWGIDFVKLDRCELRTPDEKRCPNCWTEEIIEEVYRKWRKILDEKNSDIVLSISAYKFREWNPDVCNMSRTTGDIACRLHKKYNGPYFNRSEGTLNTHPFSVMEIADLNNEVAGFAGNGYWNDPDMLVTGQGLSRHEEESHFALWCIMSSPLFLGNDPRNMTSSELEIVSNKLAIEINQDPSEQGKIIIQKNGMDIWVKRLSDGTAAMVVLNRNDDTDNTISFSVRDLGLNDELRNVTDVYSGEKLVLLKKQLTVSLKPHQCKFLKLCI